MSDSMSPPRTTLDHVQGFSVEGTPFSQPVNEYWALVCLSQGLTFLNRQVAQAEAEVRRRLGDSWALHSWMGNAPVMQGLPIPLITVGFHWYSVSACNYVRTVGAIMRRTDASRPLPPKYVEEVIPDVLLFRDKVGAHLAGSTQSNWDNDADRLSSLLPPLAFNNGRFHVGTLAVTTSSGSTRTSAVAPRPWSLTEVHERLGQRYWPDAVPKSATVANDP